MDKNNAHDVASVATTAVDATVDTSDSAGKIYGKFAIGQTYPTLPPAPQGYEVRAVNDAAGGSGMKYVEAGTPRERSGSRGFNGRGVYGRLYQSKLDKGRTSSRFVLDAPVSHGDELVVFNAHGVPALMNAVHIGPRAVITDKGRDPYISGDNLLIATTIAARIQAQEVSHAAAKKLGTEYTGKPFFKDGVNFDEILESPDLIDKCRAYASPGGDGWNGRVTHYANDTKVEWGSKKATSRIAVISRWLESEAERLGYDPNVVKGQIQAHIKMLSDANLPVPEELKALVG
jgi:hypothetical protein